MAESPDPAEVTLAIMARNEQPMVGDLVRQSKAYAEEVMVVDGHSDDGTAETAQEAGARVVLDGGKGKGDGYRTAIAHAKTPYLIFMDCDGSHIVEHIPRLIAPLKEGRCDLVIGSRATGGSDDFHGDFETVIRVFGSHIVTMAINWRFGTTLTEAVNGFRAIRVDVARQIGLREDGFTIEHEMIIRTLLHGYRVGEVPTHELKRKAGESKINLLRIAPYFVAHLLYLLASPKGRS